VPNTLIKHDFQDDFKNYRSNGTVHVRGRGVFPEWWWPVGTKLAFTRWQHESRKLWITCNFISPWGCKIN
jgi:hypothetical protein